ncbi:MAG: Holliday junction resolvase RuvX [Dehalococcoidia bacterium]|nr:Holliday junction resolvase RuvX [Dehalococcoidia bacterium]
MRSLGVDVGGRRTGVAISDADGILASPLAVIDNGDDKETIAEILKLAQRYHVQRLVVGLPYSLQGGIGQQADRVRNFARELAHSGNIEVKLCDERFSTIAADKLMVEAGVKKRKKKERRDAIAAAFILQGFLDSLES